MKLTAKFCSPAVSPGVYQPGTKQCLSWPDHFPGVFPGKGTLLQGWAAAAPSPVPGMLGHGLGHVATKTSQSRVFHSQTGTVWLPNNLLRTHMRAKNCIFVAWLSKCNWIPVPLAFHAKHRLKAQWWLQRLSSEPSAATFMNIAWKAFNCVTKARSWGLQDQILPSGMLQKLCTKWYSYLPSSVALVKQSSVTATQKGHSSYPAEKEGNTRDCWVTVSNNTQSIFIGTTFASPNINKATNESNRV